MRKIILMMPVSADSFIGGRARARLAQGRRRAAPPVQRADRSTLRGLPFGLGKLADLGSILPTIMLSQPEQGDQPEQGGLPEQGDQPEQGGLPELGGQPELAQDTVISVSPLQMP